jgi:hypothetical protein
MDQANRSLLEAAGSGDVEKLQVDHLCTHLSIRGRYASTMGRAADCRRRLQRGETAGAPFSAAANFRQWRNIAVCTSPGGGARLSSFRTVERSRPAGGFPPRSLAR